MPWTTLEMAKKQVGIPLGDTDLDDLLRQYLAIAEAQCLRFVQNDPVGTVTVATQPDIEITGAIYIQFAELWRFRGDDEGKALPDGFIPGAPCPAVCRLLLPRRPPSCA